MRPTSPIAPTGVKACVVDDCTAQAGRFFKRWAESAGTSPLDRGHRASQELAHSLVLADVGLVTCWLEQDYTYQGKKQHVSTPTTTLLRRSGSDWKLALFHSVPLPEGA
jgi:hypothetical protein